MAEIKVEKSLGESWQEVRYELTKVELKKTGYNPYGKFNFFQLDDFMPTVIRLMHERGLYSRTWIGYEGDIEFAYLVIGKGNEEMVYKFPTAEANNSQNPIQNAGSKITYCRRYLWMLATELTENDLVDAVSGSPDDKKINYATRFQVDKLSQYKEKLIDEFKEINVKSVNDIKHLTVEQASDLITKLEQKLQHEG